MKDKGAPAKAMVRGVVSHMHSNRCKNQSYYKKFQVDYSDHYRNDQGDVVYVEMNQVVVCFNEVARKVREEVSEGDLVYLVGRLKSRYSENYETERYIEVEEPEDIVKLPTGGFDEEIDSR
jgi:methyl coenzyme M reductase gamma subunit